MKMQNNLEGSLDGFPEKQIYLNINNLDDGTYALKIIYKSKVIKEVVFKKSKQG